MGVVVALILDFWNPALAEFSGGTRFMIFMLETANTRFAGKSNCQTDGVGEHLCFSRLCDNGPQHTSLGNVDHFRSADGRQASNGDETFLFRPSIVMAFVLVMCNQRDALRDGMDSHSNSTRIG